MYFRYRSFRVYKEAIEFHRLLVKLTEKFPKAFEYLSNQIRRSSLSVVLNVAEGSAKGSDKDFNRYISISLGSVNESMAGCEVALVENLIDQEEFNEAEGRAITLTQQLGSLKKKLSKPSVKS